MINVFVNVLYDCLFLQFLVSYLFLAQRGQEVARVHAELVVVFAQELAVGEKVCRNVTRQCALLKLKVVKRSRNEYNGLEDWKGLFVIIGIVGEVFLTDSFQ